MTVRLSPGRTKGEVRGVRTKARGKDSSHGGWTIDHGLPGSCRHLIPGDTCPAGHHEGSVLESGEWVMSTFRCAANVAER